MKTIFDSVKAILAIFTIIISTSLVFIPILLLGLLKLIPIASWQGFCTRRVDNIATIWCDLNNFYINKLKRVQIDVTGLESIQWKQWHFVVANHQSWLDIVILQRLFNRKIPVLKFFIKDQLKWVPLLGFAWWAMGCPFMKRYSKSYLEKYPHKQGRDLKSTLKAITQFQRTPASITNFLEGTRYTKAKAQLQNTPYTHLLKPKAGGLGFVIGSMGDKIQQMIDVSIVYNSDKKTLWDFLCNRIQHIKINIRAIDIPQQFCRNELLTSDTLQNDLKNWLNERWLEKDIIMQQLTHA